MSALFKVLEVTKVKKELIPCSQGAYKHLGERKGGKEGGRVQGKEGGKKERRKEGSKQASNVAK